MKRRRKIISIAIIVIIIFIVIIATFLNPLRKSENIIREDILKRVPIGSKMEDVSRTINNTLGWNKTWIDNEHGYVISDDLYPPDGYIGEVGTKSIRANIGKYHYRFIYQVEVDVYFGFDEDMKLIDIEVVKKFYMI